MLVEIDFAVADDGSFHNWLDRILHKIDDGWHVWDTSNVVDTRAFDSSSWIRDRGIQGEWVRELLVASLQRDVWTSEPHGRRLLVTSDPLKGYELTPEDAARLAEEPVVFLVENRNSDGSFVERIVTECDKTLWRLWRRPGLPIRLDSVGGIGEMPKEVRRRAQGVRVRPRLVVIVDSERTALDAEESQEARSVKQACEEHGVACWILAKRESENYLPRALLDGRRDAGREHAVRVEAWDRLSADQKDLYDMKKGLPQEPTEPEEALFDGLSPDDRSALSAGFGPNVWHCWTLHQPISTELLDRGRGDLEHGIALIRKEV